MSAPSSNGAGSALPTAVRTRASTSPRPRRLTTSLKGGDRVFWFVLLHFLLKVTEVACELPWTFPVLR